MKNVKFIPRQSLTLPEVVLIALLNHGDEHHKEQGPQPWDGVDGGVDQQRQDHRHLHDRYERFLVPFILLTQHLCIQYNTLHTVDILARPSYLNTNYYSFLLFLFDHRLNMELNRQSLFGLHLHSWTHWLRLRNRNPSPPPSLRIWPHIRSSYWSVKIDDISLRPPIFDSLLVPCFLLPSRLYAEFCKSQRLCFFVL